MAISFDKVDWKHALKTAIAAGISLALARILHLRQGYWACVSAIVVMQSETEATVAASWDRVVGTAFGALIGWMMAEVWQDHLLAYVIAILMCMVITHAMGLKNAGRLAGVTTTIILLIPTQIAYWRAALDRFIEVTFGILVALAVSHALWRTTTSEPPSTVG